MVTESGLWQYIKTGMKNSGWHATRIESSASPGVPDVTFGMDCMQGWIELKFIKSWPVRETTKVKLPLRPEQKLWIGVRGRLSGNVWVLCRIDKDFFLLDYNSAISAVDGWTKREWCENLQHHWIGRIKFNELADCLERGY